MEYKIDLFEASWLKQGVCPECLMDHTPQAPHSKDSLYYQCTFYTKHKRWPTWEDAAAHCAPMFKGYDLTRLNEN